jgi:glutamine synthetase
MNKTLTNERTESIVKTDSGNGKNPRNSAVRSVQQRQPVRGDSDYVRQPLAEVFRSNVFDRAEMRTRLPKSAYKAICRCLDEGERLEPELAEVVASELKDWALSRGATHFTHWFHPMTGFTAEKHDSFLQSPDEEGALLGFSGKNLIQGEPDASSFPSGGIRSTFEARGYTGWDPTSPAFIRESTNGKTLCIPSVFCSFSGHALDKKTPLLRSLDAINITGVRLLKLLGNENVRRVSCTLGLEQEFFLVDESFYLLRPDLINCGRALFGAKPPKGQEMEDHYWGSIKERVLSFMMDTEYELYKLGVPVKTRHNEVAPAQFEVAPIFEDSNLATDHNLLTMEVFKQTAEKHGFRCLLHEKPYSGINGSGKHNNWSLVDNEGNNLLDPGDTPEENRQFLVVLTAVIRAINQYAAILRASIASPGNDHRLGANEAPPAIMSIFLGDRLQDIVLGLVFAHPEKGGKATKTLEIGVSTLPELPMDDSDRNRTSPFAFTGNRFEFRAVGSSQSIGWPNTVLNTAVADSLGYICDQIEKEMNSGATLDSAVQKVIIETLSDNRRVLFSGNNYSEEWEKEAAKRGLPNFKNTVEALPSLISKEAKDLFTRYKVLDEEELASIYNVLLEHYSKTTNIEAQMTRDIASVMILPAAVEYETRIANAIVAKKGAISDIDVSTEENMLRNISDRISKLKQAIEHLEGLSQETGDDESEILSHARYYQGKIIPAMNNVRDIADELEIMIDDELWPLPKFREMLYIY